MEKEKDIVDNIIEQEAEKLEVEEDVNFVIKDEINNTETSYTVGNNNTSTEKSNKKKNNNGLIILLLIVIIGLVGYIAWDKTVNKEEKETYNEKTKDETKKNDVEKKKVSQEYKIEGNGLNNFDLAFLKLENNDSKNKIYSPLSIKYALEMLSEGASGETKEQLDNVIGTYQARNYKNSSNRSFANALFVRDSFNIEDGYKSKLKNKYNAEVVYDSFSNANRVNDWVKDKTLNLIDKLYSDEDIKKLDFALINALAIDMEWTNLIQAASNSGNGISKGLYSVSYEHEEYNAFIAPIENETYRTTKFNNSIDAKSVEIGATVNKYDIVNDLGKENIKNTIKEEYTEWLKTDPGCVGETDPDKYADSFIEQLNSNYKKFESSTDFYFHDDENVKVFAKDLKEYDGSTLEYVGIMPKKTSLSDYIKDMDAQKINNIINSLKYVDDISNYEEGVVTKITGFIPLFKYDYKLDLMKDLKSLGIVNVFDKENANLDVMTKNKNTYISSASHKANIEFSNEGIKAAAVTDIGGLGDASCGFEHKYKVPVKEIDLTFNNPYLYLIRDKNTGEIWFVGTVYEPIKNETKEN